MASQALPASSSSGFSRDFAASIVVFLVAMPLCMGIAVASGLPPEKGLITGIIGGIVVGAIAGSPLQVSGPAAGLAVIVFELIRTQGIEALGPILLIAGAVQLIAGVMKLGGWFRAISPAVVHGMLAGIGVLIVIGQFHVLFDAKPLASGLENIAAMPGRLLGLNTTSPGGAELALLIAAITIGVMLAWEKWRPESLRLVPGALLGVVAGTVVSLALGMNVARVEVPDSILAAITPPTSFAGWLAPEIIAAAIAVAFIASAETLLSAAAVDKMHDGPRSDFNKELRAQGVGNMLCGGAGALPMTGVIVRSSANVQAGAVSRLSAILHGVWILAFVALLPSVMRAMPMATLGAVLVVTGWRLVKLDHARELLRHHGVLPVLIWATTLVLVVAVDLLTGVIVGILFSLVELIPHVRSLRLRVDHSDNAEGTRVRLSGSATFVQLPKLEDTLGAIPRDRAVTIDCGQLSGLDHSCAELLRDWVERRKAHGSPTVLLGDDKRLRRLAAA
ncbi:MAG: SulP family inorganic anion transporter [Sphingopyxis sp.]|nr:SulP family inorganic anion transporter [Sphingopyxis sp.]